MNEEQIGGRPNPDDGWKPVKELRESLLLLALMLSSMSAFIGLAAVAVRLFAGTR